MVMKDGGSERALAFEVIQAIMQEMSPFEIRPFKTLQGRSGSTVIFDKFFSTA